MTLKQAENKISKLGGYAHIERMPLEQRNAYASQELKRSLSLNADWLFERANKKQIDLCEKLEYFDRNFAGKMDKKESEVWHWMWSLINELDK